MTALDDIIDPVVWTLSAQLVTMISGHMTTAYLSGSAEMVKWGKAKRPGVQLPFEGPPMPQAVKFAKTSADHAVKGMDTVTRDRLKRVVSNAIDKKRGVDGLARDIRKVFSDMTMNRSTLIARTETANALEESFLDRSKDLGVTGKQWITVGDDDVEDICRANAAEGKVKLDHIFSSGVTRPSTHPNCRCALAPVMLPTSR